MISRSSARRTAVDRWIASLNPMFQVIQKKMLALKLGEPRLSYGPTSMIKDNGPGPDTIRRGAIWFLSGTQAGFHVDFHKHGLQIEAWSGKDRRVCVWAAGEYTEQSLKKDLTLALAAAGLTDLARTTEVRNLTGGR